MKRILFLFLTTFAGLAAFSQPIVVNNTTYTVPQLVTDVLFAPSAGGQASCVGTINNITWSTGTNFGSVNGIGYFTNSNPNFPLSSGVILSTGNAINAHGPNTSTLSNGTSSWPGDQDLTDYMAGLGIIDPFPPTLDEYFNATVLEFDFVPLTNHMSFDFLFASEEYGDFQCTYSDAFAFFLTDVTDGTAPTNLALVPSTTTPISVTTIRDDAGEPTCGEENIDYFGSNNENGAAASSATNFNGQTTVITANSAVVPGHTYHIKLVISDLNDSSWDSAVFLGGGSFDIGTPNISGSGPTYGAINDFTGINAVCGSTNLVLQASPTMITGATYDWTLAGNSTGTNSNLLPVSQQGTYGITITYPGGCQQSDTIQVDFLPTHTLGTPNDLTQCSAPFNLTSNTPIIRNGMTVPVKYYHTLVDAQQQAIGSINNATALNYNGTDGEIIYASVEDPDNGCIITTQFTLHIDLSLCTPPPVPGSPPDLYHYETTLGGGISTFNLNPQTAIVYGTNAPAGYTVTYYLSLADANAGINPITNLTTFTNTSNPQRIYAVLSDNSDPTLFAVTSFQLIVVALPNVTISGATTICSGNTATITFTGTPGATFNFTENGTPMQRILNASGSYSYVSLPLTVTTVYNLVNVTITTPAGTTIQPEMGSVTVNVTTPPAVIMPSNYVVCDDSLDNDGYYCAFDLSTKINQITGGNAAIHVDFYETATSASPIPPGLYCNITPNAQIIYVRTYTSSPNCYSTTTFNLIVNPIPIPNPVITDYKLCDYNNPGDGVEIFNLGTKSAEVANGQANVTVSYYATLANAQAQTSPLPNLYSNTSNPQQIFINIKDNTTGCNTTGSFNLIVNPLPVAHPAPTLFQCSNGLNLSAAFDLRVNENTVNGGLPGLTVSYFHTLADVQGSVNPITNPSNYTGNDGETIIIRLQDDATGCYSTTTQLLRVTQGPVAIAPIPMQICDPNNDGFGVFNLDSKIPEISGGTLPAGVSVTFHETQTDAHTGANPLVSPYTNIVPWSQIVYVRVFYTLTGCANYTQMKLNVNPTPIATQPTDYALCDFTSPSGVETFNLTTKIPEILGSINPALTTVTFYTTMADAQAPSNAITNVTSYTSAATTLYVRVQTTATGCYDIVPLNLVINPLPVTLQPAYLQYSLCDNDQSHIGFEVFDLESKIDDILLGQTGMDVTIYPSFSNAQNNTNAIPAANLVAYENTIQYVQTLGIRVTNHATGCYAISTMDIRVEPLPVLTPPAQPYTLCDQDQDGYTTFDLTTLIPGLLNGITTYSLSFHETLVDAQHNGTTIPNPSSYDNILAFMQLLYVRAEDNNTHCVSITPIELDVDPSPIAPVFLNDIKVCDDDSNPQDASTPVDLTQRTPDVLAQQPLAASNYAVSYYHLQNDAQVPQNPIIPSNNYIGTDNETVWVRVENTVTGCFNVGSFQLDIHTPLLLSTPTPLNVCDADAIPNDQLYVFDLSIKDNEINQGTTGTVTYYPSLGDAQSGTNVIATPTAYLIQTSPVQTLGVVVTTADGCQSITTLDIRVLPIPTPNTNPPALAAKCDDNNPGDGIEVFDLTVNEAYIGNHDPNVTFHYYASQADAVVPQNEIANPHAAPVGGNVWIRVENNRVDYQGNNCYVLVEQPLRVNPLPVVVQPLNPFPACDDNADGFTVFNLADAQLTTAVLGASQAVTDYTVSYYLTQAGANPLTNTGESALPSSFTNTQANNQTIYIRVTNNATGCVNATGTLDLVVEAYARAVSPALYTQCDQDPSPFDGMVGINLDTLFTTTVLDGQDPTVFLISYYDTDPTLNPNAQALSGSEVQNHVVGPDTIVWAMVENSSNSIVPHCRAVAPIHIKIEPRPDPVIHGANGMSTICVDYSDNTVIRSLELESGIANPGNYSFEWFEGSNPVSIWNGPTYTVDTASPGAAPRDYTVHVTNGFGLGCDYTSAPFTVIQSGPAEVAPGADPGYVVSEAFSDHQSITVNVVGYGTYEYSLDDGPRQSSNVFEDVTLGTRHVIHVWDVTDGVANSCEELLLEYAQTIDYPHYFTPNGDGIHDVWNISGLSDQHNAKIYIFDRYGKLLKQIGSSQNGGWDGTYNGHLMPSDDYWFTVDYTENAITKQFRAHFSLKR